MATQMNVLSGPVSGGLMPTPCGERGQARIPIGSLAWIAASVATGGVIAWAYFPTLIDIATRWVKDPQYSHGFLVPLFSIFWLWRNRRSLRKNELHSDWWGLGIVSLAVGLRLAGLFFYQPWLDSGSFLVLLAGIALAIGGRPLLVWAWPAILFLGFMLPLPFRFQTMLGGELQRIATFASTYALQTIGVPAVAEGNVIQLSETRIGVVEACSGLSMLVTFFALAVAVIMLAGRNGIERAAVFISAVPIAIFANVVRLTVTGALYEADRSDLARTVFHDVAGFLMMPFGLGLLLLELHVLRRAVVFNASSGENNSPA